MKNESGIEHWRRRIDEINAALLGLLQKRVTAAQRIGAIKRKRGMAISDRCREKAILDHLVRQNRGPLDNQGLRTIFKAIIRETKRIERGVEH
jgi:chorismate mutase